VYSKWMDQTRRALFTFYVENFLTVLSHEAEYRVPSGANANEHTLPVWPSNVLTHVPWIMRERGRM
jgi:hypothetical protein